MGSYHHYLYTSYLSYVFIYFLSPNCFKWLNKTLKKLSIFSFVLFLNPELTDTFTTVVIRFISYSSSVEL